MFGKVNTKGKTFVTWLMLEGDWSHGGKQCGNTKITNMLYPGSNSCIWGL